MSLLSQLFASAAVGGDDPQLLFVTTAIVWTAPHDCTVRVHAFGGSGSGGIIRGSNGTATGGGAGARCTKTVKLKAGDVLTLTPGAGGAAPSTSPSSAVNGNDGGDTTVTGPNGLNMVAGGGKGGKAAINNSLTAVDGGAGGVGSGGDENVTGGRGGNANPSSGATHTRATGGGALPLLDAGYRGGDITATSATGTATGGGGVGGRGGDAGGASISNTCTGGGSAFGPGVDVTTSTNNGAAGPDKPASDADIPLTSWFPYSGAGSPGKAGTSLAADHGGGSGGAADTAASSGNVASFGGSGGIAAGSSGGNVGGGLGLPVGGSGGAVASTNTVTVPRGGDGFIIMEIF